MRDAENNLLFIFRRQLKNTIYGQFLGLNLKFATIPINVYQVLIQTNHSWRLKVQF